MRRTAGSTRQHLAGRLDTRDGHCLRSTTAPAPLSLATRSEHAPPTPEPDPDSSGKRHMPAIEHIGPEPVPHDATEVVIPMRDGVRLAADLYLTGSSRPGPVVLVRIPYDKGGAFGFMPPISRHFRARGYHVVVQDVRGKYRSEGVPEFAVNEVDDGYDTIQWLTEQVWCDGDVVMWGDSYYGYTTIAAAISGHPALKAFAPRVTGS
ncbi:MAG TPA: CocE/NonD family hydrolase, partial [Nonomuraea sp.]|nr:CocE/NonD family hydrolase [Nonomuraea sp.]